MAAIQLTREDRIGQFVRLDALQKLANNLVGEELGDVDETLANLAGEAIQELWPGLEYDDVPLDYILAVAQSAGTLAGWLADLGTAKSREYMLERAEFFGARAAEHAAQARRSAAGERISDA